MTDLGCFGLPSTYNESSPACGACPHRNPCKKSAFQILQAVRGLVDISAFLEGLTDKYLVVNTLPIEHRVNAAPAKIRDRLRRMLESGQHLALQARMSTGQNPFRESQDVCMFEMGRQLSLGGFTRSAIADHLMSMGWKESSARSHVSNCIALLKALDLVEYDGQLIVPHSHIKKVPLPE